MSVFFKKSGNLTLKHTIIMLTAWVVMLICTTPDLAMPSGESNLKRILVLNSYHQGYVWADSVTDGIRSVFDRAGPDLRISFEYMDTKRYPPDVIFESLRELYRFKYRNIKFDAIIASDNNALNFMLAERDKLFPGTPVVFCGINGYSDEMLGGARGVTGVAEDYDLKGTLDLALRMHPDTQYIAVVSGMSTSSLINQQRLRTLMPDYEKKITFIDLSGKPLPDLENALRSLPEKTIIVYLSYYLSPEGITLTVQESTSLVFRNADRPIYSPWDYTLGYGVLGGMMLSGREQGRSAADIALRILSGTPADDIPVLRKSAINQTFDYNMLKHFRISLSSLPKDSMIVNEPVTVYYRYKTFIWVIIAFILYQSVTIAALMRIIARRKLAEGSLRLEEARLEALLELSRMTDAPLETIMESSLKKAVELTRSHAGCLAIMNKNGEPQQLYILSPTALIRYDKNDPSREFPDIPESWKDAVAGREPVIHSESPEHDHTGMIWPENDILIDRSLILPIFEGDLLVAIACVANKKTDFDTSDARQLTLLIRGMMEPIRRKDAADREKKLEAQLRQAQKLEAIGTFAGGIAHDFNNILGSITTCSELAIEDIPEDNPVHEDLKHILKASLRGKNLVKRILEFSRNKDQQRQPVQMINILKECVYLLKSFITPSIEVRLNILAESGLVLADPTQIHQVIMNLCTNAKHAVSDKNGIIDITLDALDLEKESSDIHPDLHPGRYSRLSVKDNGRGIDESLMERIFDPFFSTRKKNGGTGLGLSMSHGIIKRHGGAITVESSPGTGTIFSVWLPCANVVKEPPGKKLSVSIPKGKECILLVDDDENMIYSGDKLLKRLGYDVISRSSSLEALELFRKQPDRFDLIITDRMMPHMNGIELADELLNIRPDIPVILCSGFADDNGQSMTVEEEMNSGIRGFLAKPFNREDISRTIRNVLDSWKKK